MQPVTRAFAMELSPATERVLAALTDGGFTPYIVGGSVRDALMAGGRPKDVDIEVYGGDVAQVAAALRRLGRVDEVGRSFGVLKLTLRGEDFDVSLPRRDSKNGSGHRGFTVEADPHLSTFEASARRDFTINALMYDHATHTIIDHHGGLQDLREGHLRHVSDAFDEDPLRVLRGAQMAARFGMRLHPSTVAKSAALRDQYNTIAAERVQLEFQKLYARGTNVFLGFEVLQQTGWDRLFPGLPEVDFAVLAQRLRTAEAIADLAAVQRTQLLAAAVAGLLPTAQRQRFLTYTMLGDDPRRIARQLTMQDGPSRLAAAELRAWVRDLPRGVDVAAWARYQAVIGHGQIATEVMAMAAGLQLLGGAEPDLLNGTDLLNLFPDRRPGPWVRRALDRLRTAQYADEFRTYTAGLAWATAHRAVLTAD